MKIVCPVIRQTIKIIMGVLKMNEKGSGKFIIIAVVILLVLGLLGSGSDDDGYSGYSSDYRNDSGYRDDVNDVADIFGEDPRDVDSAIQAVVDEMNS